MNVYKLQIITINDYPSWGMNGERPSSGFARDIITSTMFFTDKKESIDYAYEKVKEVYKKSDLSVHDFDEKSIIYNEEGKYELINNWTGTKNCITKVTKEILDINSKIICSSTVEYFDDETINLK